MSRYRVWNPQGMGENFTVKAVTITAAAIEALKELGYDIEELKEDEE